MAAGAIAPLDTETASWAWFGAINELVVRWLVTGRPEQLETLIPQLRQLLLRSVGAPVPASTGGGSQDTVTVAELGKAEP
jgi:hypothetical protein